MDAKTPALAADLIDRFAAIVGAANALRDEASIAPYLIEPRAKFIGRTPLVLRPGSVAEVSAILRLANETSTPIVPQGGNTGVVGGQIPDASGREILVSLSRLNRIREVDTEGDTMTVEAGRDPRRGAARRRRRRPPVPAGAGLGGLLPDRRQSLDQCRRHRRARLWQHPEPGARASRSCSPRARSGTGSASSARTIPATTSAISSSAPRGRSASSPPRCSGCFRSRAARASPSSGSRTRRRRCGSSMWRGSRPRQASPRSS